MERIGPRLRQRAVLRLVCLWLVACAWTGCAAKGGAKPWEGIFASRNLKGQDSGDQSSGEETGAEDELQAKQEMAHQEWEPAWAFPPHPQEIEWPSAESLEPSWRRALNRTSILEMDGQNHPAVQRFALELRREGDSSGGLPISRSSRYLPRMREIFREEGVPEELVYLAFVESRFNPWLSSAGKCVGIWQFTEATGRRYGLRIDSWVDERRDPEKSTRAAARYLRDLYQTFRSWDLAIAAYNAGEAAIAKSLARGEASSFWDLYPSGGLSRATREFVPKVMAAILVAQEEEERSPGLDLAEDFWRFDRVRIQEHLDLGTVARLAGCTEKELRDLNPHVKSPILNPGSSGLEIRVPEGKGEEIKALLSEKGRMVRASRPAQGSPTEFRSHRVRPGETLEKIAPQYGTTPEELRRWNLLGGGKEPRSGTDLLVPVVSSKTVNPGKGRPESSRADAAAQGREASGAARLHRVQKGESLWSISRRYGVSVDDLMRWNSLKGSLLQPGASLRVAP